MGLKTLIVCTKGGISVWVNHLLRMGVDRERIIAVNPTDRGPFDAELLAGALNYDYYIIHWNALMLVEGLYQPGVRALEWDHVIADEAHLAKNRKAERTLRLKKIKARVRTAVTGTPADNKPQDIWSILHWLDKKTYSSYWDFFNQYIDWEMAFTRDSPNGYRKIKGIKNIDVLHAQLRPFYIRRTLTEVIDEMPDKTHTEIMVDLTPRQRTDYDAMYKWQVAQLGELGETLVVTAKIAMYMRLQQMTAGTCDLDWDFYEKFWDKHQYDTDEELPKHCPSGPRVRIGEESPKVDALMELIEAAPDDEQFVVFTNLKDVISMVEARCRKAKITCVTYSGKILSQKTRDANVARFQSGAARVFVGTVASAGTTITLTAAHTLIFLDRHWNSSMNEQAEDRIWRIGQKNACQIIDIIARDTYDEPKTRKIWEKAESIHELVDVKEVAPNAWS